MNRLGMMMMSAALLAAHASATVTCVTDKSTGSSTTAADCATCENSLKGCCYYTAGDCKPKMAVSFHSADISPPSPATGHGSLALDVIAARLDFDIFISDLSTPESGTVISGPSGPGGSLTALYDLPTGSHKVGALELQPHPGYSLEQQRLDVLAGRWVVTTRTAAHPLGEISGTIEPAPPCIGDASDDGIVNFADITTVITNFGGGWHEGDADGNGSVDFADVAAVLGSWGEVCP
ncbi:MAG: hypothetical protein JNK58_11850 [Phycisphaerae bacterium]|nr:hypothetical protein [Phycisphaerae bacterium]